MKKITCSKKIILASYICAIALTLVVIIGTFKDYDMSNIAMIAGLAWGEVAVSNTFYYEKAKKENIIKIAIGLSKQYEQEFDINNVFNNM